VFTCPLHGLVDIDKSYVLNNTRSNVLKLYKSQFTMKFSFSQRISNDWNILPHDVVSVPNFLIFKTKFGVFLFNCCFDYVTHLTVVLIVYSL